MKSKLILVTAIVLSVFLAVLVTIVQGTSGFDGYTRNGLFYENGVVQPVGAINVKGPPYNATGDGVTDDTAAITAAEAAADDNGGILFFSPGDYELTLDLTISANVALQFAPGATISVATTKTLTIQSPTHVRALHQWITRVGTGTVAWTAPASGTIEAQWWCVLDGTTDDAANFQACVNSLGNTTYMRPGKIHIGGPMKINSTVTIERKAVEIYGDGWGSGSYGGTIVKWGGSAGSAMFTVHRCEGAHIHHLRFVGDSTAVPSAGIYMYQLSADGNRNGPNKLEFLRFGPWGGFDGDDAVQFTNGILFDGDNVTNAENVLDFIRCEKCTTGVKFTDSQNNNALSNFWASSCGTAIYADSRIVGWNWFLDNSSTADLNLGSNGRMFLSNYYSELSAKMALVTGTTELAVSGGYFQYSANLSDANMIDGQSNLACTVTLDNFTFMNAGGGDAYVGTHIIQLRENPGGDGAEKSLILRNCKGITETNVDMTSNGAAGNDRFFQMIGIGTDEDIIITQNYIPGGTAGSIDEGRWDVNYLKVYGFAFPFAIKNAATSAGYLDLYENSGNGTNYIRTIGPASTGTAIITLPIDTEVAQTGVLLNTAGTLTTVDTGVSGTLVLDDGATEKITLTFTNGVLTTRLVEATTSTVTANWTD